jgi:hypothetical protein
LLRASAGFEIAQGGSSPLAGVGKAARAAENEGGVVASIAGSKALLPSFSIANRFAVVTESRVDVPSVAVNVSYLVVSSREIYDGIPGEHFECLFVILLGF